MKLIWDPPGHAAAGDSLPAGDDPDPATVTCNKEWRFWNAAVQIDGRRPGESGATGQEC